MRLKVLLPTQVFIDEPVTKVTAEAEDGAFCLLPRHIDFLTALVPGLLSYTTTDEQEHFLALDEGTLIKRGPDVIISTRHAAHGQDLGALEHVIHEQFLLLDDRDKKARTAAAKLEANLVRRFIER